MRNYKSSYTYCFTTEMKSINLYHRKYFDFSLEEISAFASKILEKFGAKPGEKKVDIDSVSRIALKCASLKWEGEWIYPLHSHKNSQVLRSMFAVLHETKTPVVVDGKLCSVEYDSGFDSKNFCDENNIMELQNCVKKLTNNGVWTRKTDILYLKSLKRA